MYIVQYLNFQAMQLAIISVRSPWLWPQNLSFWSWRWCRVFVNILATQVWSKPNAHLGLES